MRSLAQALRRHVVLVVEFRATRSSPRMGLPSGRYSVALARSPSMFSIFSIRMDGISGAPRCFIDSSDRDLARKVIYVHQRKHTWFPAHRLPA
jgi:hypothetical protein